MKEIIEANESVRPNSELLNTLQADFPQFFDAAGHFKADKFAEELQATNIQEARDGYRLSFVGKDYARLQTGRASETMIMPDAEHNSKPENADSQNVFITGDNLEALRHLQNAYLGKVKMIYIDPPYNTGKEFVYNDRFEFNDEKLKSALGYSNDEIARLKTIQGKSSHSAWLTFMYPRLKLAQKLLSNDGVIFVSIDDNEQANLKLLMDDVFGEGNFVAIFPWRKRTAKSDVPFGVSQDYEWIISFTKQNLVAGIEVERKYYSTEDYPDDRWRLSDLTKQTTVEERPNSAFDMIDPVTNKIYPANPKRSWAVSKDTFEEYYQKGKIVFPDDYDFLKITIPAYRVFESEDKAKALKKFGSEEARKAVSTCLPKEIGFTEDGNKEIIELFGEKLFSFPKPIELIKHFSQIINDKNATILDFFAGSATTAHAVMELNAKDGGNRKFIMVQLNEQTNPDSEARKAGYNTIDEISRERIKRAATKIKSKNPVLAENLDLGFKHYRLATPAADTLDKITEFNLTERRIFKDDMVSALGGLETILATWLIDDGYDFSQSAQNIDFAGYAAHYIDNSVLYLISQGWGAEQTRILLNKIGKHELNVNTIIVFGYCFTMESLRELEMNVKNTLDRQVLVEKRY